MRHILWVIAGFLISQIIRQTLGADAVIGFGIGLLVAGAAFAIVVYRYREDQS